MQALSTAAAALGNDPLIGRAAANPSRANIGSYKLGAVHEPAISHFSFQLSLARRYVPRNTSDVMFAFNIKYLSESLDNRINILNASLE